MNPGARIRGGTGSAQCRPGCVRPGRRPVEPEELIIITAVTDTDLAEWHGDTCRSYRRKLTAAISGEPQQRPDLPPSVLTGSAGCPASWGLR